MHIWNLEKFMLIFSPTGSINSGKGHQDNISTSGGEMTHWYFIIFSHFFPPSASVTRPPGVIEKCSSSSSSTVLVLCYCPVVDKYINNPIPPSHQGLCIKVVTPHPLLAKRYQMAWAVLHCINMIIIFKYWIINHIITGFKCISSLFIPYFDQLSANLVPTT